MAIDGTTSVDTSRDVGAVDRSADVDAGAKADLADTANAVTDADADAVADAVVGDVDAVETTTDVDPATAVGTFEPNPANRAAANAFNDEVIAIETNRELGFDKQRARADVLDRMTAHAQGIEDPAERDKFVRAVAENAGLTAGMYAKGSPLGGYQRLDKLGEGVHPDTGRLLANAAVRTGPGADNFPVWGKEGSPVGDAMVEIREGRAQRAGELLGGVARTVVPGVDATVRALDGDYEGAAGSLAVDAMGGVLAKGGKLAWGAVTGAAVLAPQDAQAGVLSRLTMKYGDETVEFASRTGLVGGRTRTFDVDVPGTFKDGTKGSLRLADTRGKHNELGANFGDANLTKLAKDVSRGKGPKELGVTRNKGQFVGRFNTEAGQAELARMVMDRVSKAELDAVGRAGGALDVRMPFPVGLTPTKGGKVVTANSVRVMRNNDGGFHLVPMP